MYARLVAFRQVEGHFKVYIRSDKPLSIWVSNQRQEKRTGKLSPDRQARLETIGFLWQKQLQKEREDHWEEMYGARERKDITGSIADVSAEEIQKNPFPAPGRKTSRYPTSC